MQALSPSGTGAPVAGGVSSIGNGTSPKSNAQAAGFADMLQVLLMALVPASVVESALPVGQAGLPATLPEKSPGASLGGDASKSGASSVWGLASNQVLDLSAITKLAAAKCQPAEQPEAGIDRAADVALTAPGGAACEPSPATVGQSAAVLQQIGFGAFKFLESDVASGQKEATDSGAAISKDTGAVDRQVLDSLLGDLITSRSCTEQAGSTLAVAAAGLPSGNSGLTASPAKLIPVKVAAQRPALSEAVGAPAISIGDRTLKVIWSSLGQPSAAPNSSVNVQAPSLDASGRPAAAPSGSSAQGGGSAGTGENPSGTGSNSASTYVQSAQGQGETSRQTLGDVSIKADLSTPAFARVNVAVGEVVPATSTPSSNTAAPAGVMTQAVFETIADRANLARLRGGNQARFDLLTGDGNTIRVRVAVHDNVVSARIGVTSSAIKAVLAQNAPQLAERLQTSGLVPETIEVSLLGGWENGSDKHQRQQQGSRSNGYRDVGIENLTLIEADDTGFEKWA